MKKLTALLVGAALMMVTASAYALPAINGQINFTGTLNLSGPGVPTTLTATGIDFVADSSIVVKSATGTYGSIPTPPPYSLATPVTFQDFTFSPSFSPVTSLWSLNSGSSTFSFDLNSISIIRTDSALNLIGDGMLHATGFEDTLGTWSLTTQNGSSEMSFSSGSAPVPEPGTMVLLGAGLLGLAIYGKRRMNKDA